MWRLNIHRRKATQKESGIKLMEVSYPPPFQKKSHAVFFPSYSQLSWKCKSRTYSYSFAEMLSGFQYDELYTRNSFKVSCTSGFKCFHSLECKFILEF